MLLKKLCASALGLVTSPASYTTVSRALATFAMTVALLAWRMLNGIKPLSVASSGFICRPYTGSAVLLDLQSCNLELGCLGAPRAIAVSLLMFTLYGTLIFSTLIEPLNAALWPPHRGRSQSI